MSIHKRGDLVANYTFKANEENAIILSEADRNEYIKFNDKQEDIGLFLYFLTDTRTLLIDESTRERKGQFKYSTDFELDLSNLRDEMITKNREFNSEILAKEMLKVSLKRALSYFRNRSIIDSRKSESGVNVLYGEILNRVLSDPGEEDIHEINTKEEIIQRLKDIEKASKEFNRYGILPKFDLKKIKNIVDEITTDKIQITNTVLNPYLESLESKYKTLSDLKTRIKSFVDFINSFYKNKQIVFTVRAGISIKAVDGSVLQPDQLSSGERQLLLLFCNTLISLDRPSIVIIDEPELSLNIKWQRNVISALKDFTHNSPIQFLFATHSFEILTDHFNNVIKLGSQNG